MPHHFVVILHPNILGSERVLVERVEVVALRVVAGHGGQAQVLQLVRIQHLGFLLFLLIQFASFLNEGDAKRYSNYLKVAGFSTTHSCWVWHPSLYFIGIPSSETALFPFEGWV
jgi:hypothetical protein